MGAAVPDEKPEPEGVLWWTFRSQTVVGHGLAVLAGYAVWGSVYGWHLSAVGGDVTLAAASGPEAIAARQAANQVASAACWLWFTLAFVRGYGGPFLDTVFYPLGALLLGPPLTALAVGGRLPAEIYTAADPLSLRLVVEGLVVSMPGFLLSVAVLGVFLGVLTFVLGTHEAWGEAHMPDAWHEYRADVESWMDAQEDG